MVLLGTTGTLPGKTVACVACGPTAGVEKLGIEEGPGRVIGNEKFAGNVVGATVEPVVIGGKGIGGIPGIDIGGKLEKFGIFERLGKPAGGGIPGPNKGDCEKFGKGAG